MISLGRGFTLLMGGARSGKSDLAVQLGQAWPGSVAFIATATAGDDDMAARIERHQAERPAEWQLVEAPRCGSADIEAVVSDSLIIVDCITLLAANLMFAGCDEAATLDHMNRLGASLAARPSPSLVITNEVGLGIIPDTSLGREYRDLLGRSNRALAATAQTTLFVAAGKVLPLTDLEVGWD